MFPLDFTDCPRGSISDTLGNCYYFSPVWENWQGAETYCEQNYANSTLPIFCNDLEQQYYYTHIL